MEEKLDSQFILRLPTKQANKVKQYLQTKPKKLKKSLFIDMDPETRNASVTVKRKTIPMKLVDLPTIVESVKTTDSKMMFKTADVCQMLMPEKDAMRLLENKKGWVWPHGITPPMKNVKKSRMRRVLQNTQEPDDVDVAKELKWLLQMDNEAVAVRWELVEDDTGMNKLTSEFDDTLLKEQEVFGDIITDSDDTSTNSSQEMGMDSPLFYYD